MPIEGPMPTNRPANSEGDFVPESFEQSKNREWTPEMDAAEKAGMNYFAEVVTPGIIQESSKFQNQAEQYAFAIGVEKAMIAYTEEEE